MRMPGYAFGSEKGPGLAFPTLAPRKNVKRPGAEPSRLDERRNAPLDRSGAADVIRSRFRSSFDSAERRAERRDEERERRQLLARGSGVSVRLLATRWLTHSLTECRSLFGEGDSSVRCIDAAMEPAALLDA